MRTLEGYSTDDSDDESDQLDGAEVGDCEDILEHSRPILRYLMDLSPSLESPAEDSSLSGLETSTHPTSLNATDVEQPSTSASPQPCSISASELWNS